MKFTINKLNVFNKIVQIPIPKGFENALDEIVQQNENGTKMTIEIKPEKDQRSLTANSYMWVVLQYLAMHYHTSKEELYIKYLREHGVFDYYGVLEEALPRLRTIYRIVENLGKFKTEDGKELVRVRVYPGTSTYDTQQFSFLMERILEDAKEIGFKPLADESLEQLLKMR